MNETQAAVELARALTENERLRQRVKELELVIKEALTHVMFTGGYMAQYSGIYIILSKGVGNSHE